MSDISVVSSTQALYVNASTSELAVVSYAPQYILVDAASSSVTVISPTPEDVHLYEDLGSLAVVSYGQQNIIVEQTGSSVSLFGAGPAGPEGPPGPEGPQGPIGPSGAGGFTFVQTTPPIPTQVGQTWWNSDDTSLIGTSWISIDRGDGVFVWVQFAGEPAVAPVQSYTHNQSTSSNIWTVVHNLSWIPNVTIFDSAGSEVEGDITHINNKQLTLSFAGSFSGKAYLS
jgi:hypothetical protein